MSPSVAAIPREIRVGDHVVQFHGSDGLALARNVGHYLCEGLRRGDGIVVIASPENRDAFFEAMTAAGCDPVRAVCDRRLVLFDSAHTLARFMVDGAPDRDRFRATAQAALERVHAPSGRLRLYGDMVALLWGAEQRGAALALETLWNELQAEANFDLFCAYPIDELDREFCTGVLGGLLCTHGTVMPTRRGAEMERALERAMHDVLGARAGRLRPLMNASARPAAWAALPDVEAAILWVRNHLPDDADAILAGARAHYDQTVAC